MTTAPVVGIAVFAALLIFDLIAHKKTKLGRRIPDWIFLCAFAFGLVFSFVNLMFPLINTGSVSVTGRYTAYRYLMDGEGELARNAAIQDAEGRSKAVDLIDLLSYAVEGDYEQTFYKANEYIGSNSLSARESENVYELLDAAKDALGSDADPGEKVKEIVENCYNQAGIRETQDLIDYYELHKKISANEEGIDSAMITQMLTDFPYEQSAKKAAVTWYVNAGMYDEAEAVAKELLEENRSESNQVIYTDVIAQRAYSASDEELAASADPEISALVVKAENSVQKALADEDRYDAHMHEADVSMESARNEMLKRVKNYINVKRPASGETSGLYDLQIIKMNLLMNDQETALNGFNSLLEKLPDISPDSPVYTALLNIQADVESYTGADDSSLNEVYLRLKAEIGRLFDAQSQGVVNAQENGINSRAADILLSLLKYSKPEIVITETDTSSYPKLDVSFEMNIARDNLFGKDGEFYKDDFRITDTGLEIAWDDVTLNTSVGSGDTAICAVVDVADAEGTLKKNITETLKKIVDGTAKRAVVASDGTVLCGFDDQMKYYTAARELMPDSGGDSYTALMAGLSLFENRTNAAKCLLWITDKNELDTALRQDIIDGAKEYGVNLYIIYAGSEDASMYRSLAASASGAVFGLDTASEMMACAREIVSLLDNRYEITYRVANSSATQRNVTIEIPEKSLEGSAGYTPEVTE